MNTTNKRGFTIIEVVLVLAIAALIFLMIFVAWPALQKSQRDTARKDDAAVVASAIGSYKSNSSGSASGLTTTNLRTYVDKLSQYDKTSISEFEVVNAPGTTGSSSAAKLTVYRASKCNTSGQATATGGTSRTAAIVVQLETPAGQAYCVDA